MNSSLSQHSLVAVATGFHQPAPAGRGGLDDRAREADANCRPSNTYGVSAVRVYGGMPTSLSGPPSEVQSDSMDPLLEVWIFSTCG